MKIEAADRLKVLAIQTTTDPFYFPEFQNLEENIKVTKARIIGGATRVWLIRNKVEVYREHDKGGIFRYFAVEKGVDPQPSIYCVHVRYANVKPLRAGCQVGVWVDQSDSITVGISKDIFWHILFRDHDMISDSVQTSFGQRFWMNRVTEALEAGYFVYRIRFWDNKIKEAKAFLNLDAFRAALPQLWGADAHKQKIRLVIALRPLDLASHQKTWSTK